MDSSIIVTIITSAVTIITVAMNNRANNREIQHKLEKNQAVYETKLDGLKEEVNKHYHLVERVPVIEEQIKVANHRIEDLEHENQRKNC